MGTFLKARLLCSDGKLRNTQRISITGDTFFSVPCSVQVRHKNVSGYMTFLEGNELPHGYTEPIAVFIAYNYNVNHAMLPEGSPAVICGNKHPLYTRWCQLHRGHNDEHRNYWGIQSSWY